MDAVLRATAIYLVLLVILRLAGKRTLSEMTTFDFVLVLIVSEATQQALLGEDFSITMALLVILTLVALDRLADFVSYRSSRLNRITEGVPVLVVNHGRPIQEVLDREHIGLEDVLMAAREKQGLARIEQIKYAVLETSGGISVVPYESAGSSS